MKKQKIDLEIKNKVLSLLKSGKFYSEIIKIYPISRSTIHRWCKENNISYIPPSNKKYNYTKIIDALKEGNTPVEVAKKFNIPYGTMASIYKTANISFIKYQGNVRYFQNIDSNIKSYLLGFIAADGYIVQSNKSSITFGIQINIEDIEVLKLLRNEIGAEKEITFPNTKMCRFTLSNKELVQDLYNLGITQRKSKTLCNVLNNIPNQFRGSFVAGYLDGDGSIYGPNSPTRTTTVVSFRGTKELLQGIVETIDLKNYNLFYNKTWILSFSKATEVYKFYKIYSASPFNLKRKIDKFTKKINKIILKYPKVQTISSPSDI